MAEVEFKEIGSCRKEAIARGLSTYYGRPCGYGHGHIRYTIGCHCVKCTILKGKDYTGRTRERRRELERNRYAANPRRHINKVNAYYVKNGDDVREKSRKRHRKKQDSDEQYRIENAERVKKWALDNPERVKQNSQVGKHRRRALERSAEGSFTAEDVADIFKAQKGRCAYCHIKVRDDYHVDHITALSRGGTNDRSNLQILCRPCNLSKAARDPIDFARSIGKLL